VIGSVLLLLLVGWIALSIITALTRTDASGSYEVNEPFQSIRLDVDASDTDVSFADVSEPVITFDQGGSTRSVDFEQQVRGDELRITANTRGFFPFGFWPFGNDTSTLDVVLPTSMNDGSLALEFSSAAGNMNLDGDFSEVIISVTAGDLDLSGSADVLTLDSTAGDVRVDEYAVNQARLNSTAGDVTVELVELPDTLEIDSVAGDQDITLPDGEYRINTDTTAGNVTLDAPSDPDAPRVYTFSSVAGDIRVLSR
jgi:hypothetical protein